MLVEIVNLWQGKKENEASIGFSLGITTLKTIDQAIKQSNMRPLLQSLMGNRAASLTLAASVPIVGGGAFWLNSRSFFGTAKAATALPRVFFDVKVRNCGRICPKIGFILAFSELPRRLPLCLALGSFSTSR